MPIYTLTQDGGDDASVTTANVIPDEPVVYSVTGPESWTRPWLPEEYLPDVYRIADKYVGH